MKINGSDDLFLWILMFEKGRDVIINKKYLYTHKYTGGNLSESGIGMAVSSLGFTSFLKKIPYVSGEHIKMIERSRQFDINMSNSRGIKKILIVIKNADIVIHRIMWKLRCL